MNYVQDPVAFFRKVKEDTGVDFLNGLHGGTAAASLDTRNRQEEQFETYGLSPAFLRQLHITGPLTNRVFVSNVSFTCYLTTLHFIHKSATCFGISSCTSRFRFSKLYVTLFCLLNILKFSCRITYKVDE